MPLTFASEYASSKDLIDDITLTSDALSLGNFDNSHNLEISTTDAITLSTVHQAVGKERKIVFIVGANPGDFLTLAQSKKLTRRRREDTLHSYLEGGRNLYISQSQWHKREDNPHKDLPDFVEKFAE